MSYVVLAGAQPDAEHSLAEATGGTHLSLPGPMGADPWDLLARMNGSGSPDVLVLETRDDPQAALSLAHRFSVELPALPVVLLTDQPDALGLAAMRAGVRDLIPAGAGTTEVQRVLDDVIETARRPTAQFGPVQPSPAQPAAPQATRTGRVITVISPKGGSGKTTVATNLAVALARTMPHSTVLVDLDLQFGDVASALNLTPDFSLPDALRSVTDGDTIALKTYLSHHPTGRYVLPAPGRPEAADAATSAHISRLLQMLTTEFLYVVVDTSPGLSDHTLGALDRTTDPLLLTTMSVPGVRGLRKTIDTLNQLQLHTPRNQVVVNFADAGHGVTTADVEATLGQRIRITLPTSKAAPAATNLGIPLMQSRTRDPLVKALTPLVNGLLPEGVNLDRRGKHRETGGAGR